MVDEHNIVHYVFYVIKNKYKFYVGLHLLLGNQVSGNPL